MVDRFIYDEWTGGDTPVLDTMRLRDISFVKDPLLPDWRVTHIDGVYQEPPESLKRSLLPDSLPTQFVEYNATPEELAVDYRLWNKANRQFLTEYVKSLKLASELENKAQKEREKSFRKRDISDLRKAMSDLLRKVYPNVESSNPEFKGEWNGEL